MPTAKVKVFGKTIEISIKIYADFKDAFGEPSREELEGPNI